MSEAAEVYVLDTSAWLTLIEDEAGADVVQRLLEKARAGEVVMLVSFMSFMEVYYITLRERDRNEAQERMDLMAALPVLCVESTRPLSILARLVPVLMTALVAALALIPLAIAKGVPGKEILQPVATVILGGLISSTFLDQAVTPALFYKFGKPVCEAILKELEEEKEKPRRIIPSTLSSTSASSSI